MVGNGWELDGLAGPSELDGAGWFCGPCMRGTGPAGRDWSEVVGSGQDWYCWDWSGSKKELSLPRLEGWLGLSGKERLKPLAWA